MRRRPLVLWLTGALVAAVLAGCGADESRTALAVRSARWSGRGDLVLTVQCAELDTVDVAPGAGDDDLPLVTIWGRPKFGRCAPQVAVALPAATTAIEDAATALVVDLPPRP